LSWPKMSGYSILLAIKTKEKVMKQKTIVDVLNLFGSERSYLVRGISPCDLAMASGEDEMEFVREFEKEFGYPFEDMVSIWRLCHARDLLLKKIPYSVIWKLSGFKSLKEMEREWNRLVY